MRIVDHDLLGNPIYDPLEVLAASLPAPIPGVNVGRCERGITMDGIHRMRELLRRANVDVVPIEHEEGTGRYERSRSADETRDNAR